MKIELTAEEARVIGSLIEKQITTPDQYPLSLNSLVSACNQKSNRDPVMALDEAAVQRTLDGLAKRHLVVERSGFGSRVPKYQHRFCNTEFGTLKLDSRELAIVCELLLRGPQTPGELRSRAGRMASFADAGEVEAALDALAGRPEGPLVLRLAREPGKREARYAHLFGDTAAAAAEAATGAEETVSAAAPGAPHAARPATAPAEAGQRLERLEQLVQQLQAEIEALKRRLPEP